MCQAFSLFLLVCEKTHPKVWQWKIFEVASEVNTSRKKNFLDFVKARHTLMHWYLMTILAKFRWNLANLHTLLIHLKMGNSRVKKWTHHGKENNVSYVSLKCTPSSLALCICLRELSNLIRTSLRASSLGGGGRPPPRELARRLNKDSPLSYKLISYPDLPRSRSGHISTFPNRLRSGYQISYKQTSEIWPGLTTV